MASAKLRLRVVKLGGSLLDLPDLAERFRCWLAGEPAAKTVVLVGGGDMADVIRRAFAQHALSEEAAHWLCIRVLGVTAELLARLLPESLLTDRWSAVDELPADLIVLDCQRFLKDDDCRPSPLPHTWDVTSDSIAARLAERLAADELVLLKSVSIAPDISPAAAATAGLVDAYFPIAAAGLPCIRFVNLRE